MKSEWKVTSQYIGDTKMYALYRLKDINATDNSGNREYAGEYIESRDRCVAIAAAMNAKEKELNG